MIFNRSSPSLRQLNRTFIGSVLFIDIVGYSRRTVPDQLAMKEVFNRLLTDAVQPVAPAERIMVDSGDGAGVAFLGDPEDALFTALSLRDAICAEKNELGEPGFVRMGINLGPLKMVRDINGHTNMIGDGVNDAQRVMSFAEPGQVMVSHAYLDIISRFSRDYHRLFVYEGTRHDKHVREHEVYRFGPTEGTEQLTAKLNEKMRVRTRSHQQGDAQGFSLHATAGQDGGATGWTEASRHSASKSREANFIRLAAASKLQPKAAAGLLAAGLGALAVTGAVWSWTTSTKDRSAAVLAAMSEQKAENGSELPASASAAIQASSDSAPQSGVDKSVEQASRKSGGKSATDKAASMRDDEKKFVAAAFQKSDSKQTERKESNDESERKPGTVKLLVQPWGEILVDGSKRGVSPPLKSLSLTPGKHRIEIRNSQFAPFKQTVEVKSNAETTVHYVF